MADRGRRPGRPAAAARVGALQKLVTEIRRFRTEQRVPDSRRVAARIVGLDEAGLGACGRRSRRWCGWTAADDFGPIATGGGPGRRDARPGEVASAAGAVLVELDTSGRDRRGRGAGPARPGPGRRAQGARPGRAQAGQPEVRREGARGRGGGHPGPAGGRGWPRSSGSTAGWRRCRDRRLASGSRGRGRGRPRPRTRWSRTCWTRSAVPTRRTWCRRRPRSPGSPSSSPWRPRWTGAGRRR